MARHPITVAERRFATKGALDTYVRQLRDRYRRGETIPQDSEDHRFLLALIQRHPGYPGKFAAGVARFIVDDDQMKNRCFFFVNRLGSRDDFSFKLCVSGRKSTDDQNARVAARIAVVDQVLDFKHEWIDRVLTCPECNEPFDPDNCHVDHERPATFLALWQAFMAEYPTLDFATVESSLRPGARAFASQRTAAIWATYHRAAAKLRLICRTCNLSTAKLEAGR